MYFSSFRGAAVRPGSRMAGFVAQPLSFPGCSHGEALWLRQMLSLASRVVSAMVQKPRPSLACQHLPGGFSRMSAPSPSLE